MIFQYMCEKELNLNQLTVITVYKSPVEEEPKVPMLAVIPDDTVPLEKGYYHGVHVLIYFDKENGIDSKENQADVDPYPDEEGMKDVTLDDKRECH